MGGDALIKQVVEDTAAAHEGLISEPIRFAENATKINQKKSLPIQIRQLDMDGSAKIAKDPLKRRKRKERLKNTSRA